MSLVAVGNLAIDLSEEETVKMIKEELIELLKIKNGIGLLAQRYKDSSSFLSLFSPNEIEILSDSLEYYDNKPEINDY